MSSDLCLCLNSRTALEHRFPCFLLCVPLLTPSRLAWPMHDTCRLSLGGVVGSVSMLASGKNELGAQPQISGIWAGFEHPELRRDTTLNSVTRSVTAKLHNNTFKKPSFKGERCTETYEP
eukprot:1491221-Amphidinium_carterae.2